MHSVDVVVFVLLAFLTTSETIEHNERHTQYDNKTEVTDFRDSVLTVILVSIDWKKIDSTREE